MSINFFDSKCQSKTDQPKFGLCDDPTQSNSPAYIDTTDPNKWIAIVENTNKIEVTFTAIDNCIEIRKPDGDMDKRCDGMLTYQSSIIFVELKERRGKNSAWVGKGDEQLRNTICVFIKNYSIADYKSKKAYIANREKPHFQSSQIERMEKFKNETGFILIIQNTIEIKI